MFESRISAGATEKIQDGRDITHRLLRCPSMWKDVLKSALGGIVNLRTNRQQLYKVSCPCLDDYHFKKEELESVGELSKVCSEIVLTCLYLARTGRPDFLWKVNKLTPSVNKWTKACDKRPNRLISYD